VTAPGALDVSAVILDVGRWIAVVRRLAEDPACRTWQNADEADLLLFALLNARARAEDLRFMEEPDRSARLRLLLKALPLARLRQLIGNECHVPEAA